MKWHWGRLSKICSFAKNYLLNLHGGHRRAVLRWGKPGQFSAILSGIILWNHRDPEGDSQPIIHTGRLIWFFFFCHGASAGLVAWSDAHPPGMWMVAGSILTSGKTFFSWDLVMKMFLRPFSPFRWFKKGSCQLLAKEWALSTGKLPRSLAQEQCG